MQDKQQKVAEALSLVRTALVSAGLRAESDEAGGYDSLQLWMVKCLIAPLDDAEALLVSLLDND